MEVLANTSWNDLKILGTLGSHQFFNNSSNFGGIFQIFVNILPPDKTKRKNEEEKFWNDFC
jgi:hypothetical protein